MIRRWIVYRAHRKTLDVVSAHVTLDAAIREAAKRSASSGEPHCYIEQVLPAPDRMARRHSNPMRH